jgi:hypothetical protein
MGISINKLGGFQEDLKSSFFWSNNLFGFIVFSFTFGHTYNIHLFGELIFLAVKGTMQAVLADQTQNSV